MSVRAAAPVQHIRQGARRSIRFDRVLHTPVLSGAVPHWAHGNLTYSRTLNKGAR